MPRPAIVFDVNDTLLNLAGLDEGFYEVFGTTDARAQWFSQLLNLAMTETIVGSYHDFSVLGRTALEQLVVRYGIELAEEERNRLLGKPDFGMDQFMDGSQR